MRARIKWLGAMMLLTAAVGCAEDVGASGGDPDVGPLIPLTDVGTAGADARSAPGVIGPRPDASTSTDGAVSPRDGQANGDGTTAIGDGSGDVWEDGRLARTSDTTPDGTDSVFDAGDPADAADSGGADVGLLCPNTIADLHLQGEGPVDVELCDVVVTYVFEAGYFITEAPDGPATLVYLGTDDWPYPAPEPGDVIDLYAVAFGSFWGQQEIIEAYPPVHKGSVDLAEYHLDVSAGIVPSEELESRLVRGEGLQIVGATGTTVTVEYGTATEVTVYVGEEHGLCVGASFDVVQGVITEYYSSHQIRVYDLTADVANIDSSLCEDANWGFEDWTLSDPPIGFDKASGGFSAVQSDNAHGGESACELSWTDDQNQDLYQSWYMPLDATLAVTFSVWTYDDDPNGRARPGLSFYNEAGTKIGSTVFSSLYSQDGTEWTELSVSSPVPKSAATVRAFVRLYDVPPKNDPWQGTATLTIDDWSVEAD